jgi:hypothetical protein
MAKKKHELAREMARKTIGWHVPFSKKWYKHRHREQRKRMTRVVMVAEQVQRERITQWRQMQYQATGGSRVAVTPVAADGAPEG